MGTPISSIVNSKKITLEELSGKTLAVDAFNMLYQFLSTIRMRDGTPLKNSKGEVTSHLVGLFHRATTLLEHRIKLIFVYDGESPQLKKKEQAKRSRAKEQAKEQYDMAVAAKNVDDMHKYAKRTTRLTTDMISQSQQLLDALGIPWLRAPAEAEAQASHLVKQNLAYAVASQDFDCLLFGAPRVIRNLSISGKRKKKGSYAMQTVYPELVDLDTVLEDLQIVQHQLIALGMLAGTDFNQGGVPGLGPKKGLKLVRRHLDLQALFDEAGWKESQEVEWKAVFDLFENMPIIDSYTPTFGVVDAGAVHELLVDQFEFTLIRVNNALEKLQNNTAQKGLFDF